MFALLASALLSIGPGPASPSPPWLDGRSRPEDLRITLVTFSPGDNINDYWGHSAMVVEDVGLGHARLYNFGMFGFDATFINKFAQGRLEFWVADAPVIAVFNLYKSLGRDVRLQELSLSPAQAQQVATRLATNVLPENAVYLYHHYDDNCSTRPRDLLDDALGGALKAHTAGPARLSLRQHTRRYAGVNPPVSVLLDYLQNDELERPITRQQEAFLPDELEAQLDELRVPGPDGAPLPVVREKRVWFQSGRPRPPVDPPDFTPGLLAVGLWVAAVGLGLGAWRRRGSTAARVLLGLWCAGLGALGFLGFFLMGAWLFTNHTVAARNENLFLWNPLTFLSLFVGVVSVFGRGEAALRWLWTACAALAVLGVLVKVLPSFDQANWNLIALLLPVDVGTAAGLWLAAGRLPGLGGPGASPARRR